MAAQILSLSEWYAFQICIQIGHPSQAVQVGKVMLELDSSKTIFKYILFTCNTMLSAIRF